MKNQIIEMMKARGAKVTVGAGFVHACFKRERNAELTAQTLRDRFSDVRFERAYDTLVLYVR